ncbi:hypothetical protein ACIOHC_32060 [Streptomyces sp. NPDC088252]|uniref:hypothetical protein n=1 Tax=unclassified Streptomyces TaxID=2593676 RepID=UPI00382B802A
MGRPLDPSGDADRASKALRKVSEAGATPVSVSLAAESASHYVEQLEALAGIADLSGRPGTTSAREGRA